MGNGSDYYALHVKGLELPAYDVRGLKAHGLNFATCVTQVQTIIKVIQIKKYLGCQFLIL
ncbi:aldehyde ferredoxin oxidoreductase C-terminal domain-containing protein [endosymbiont 'TC1' of Trimyema compressum]|uniref:aldehyde ferredoxin oxidoreductase C-terminal domain-containing protein n=1 Tax=endosymbiont 'TC1' of Trimyema compressum TaxID=243899 RepID=UPI003CCBF836